ncbi:hypothetical protein [Komagataeibacter sp. FNDCF1]|uniref:hypothetical protein n=1 Tax=Komagataeibacter sp. FNDCF1 TaxID=2878681 RepID=UPI001E352BC4|nr:hypothetical protein [Komagataeibacter sp. FNDCF1]MCE2563817.1 hypothetical protein [Komagataeibacter sp. FNDCF1]
MAMRIPSLHRACLFMESAFLDLLDILAWQEGITPVPAAPRTARTRRITLHGHAAPGTEGSARPVE